MLSFGWKIESMAQKLTQKGSDAGKRRVTADIFFSKSQYEIATIVAGYLKMTLEEMCASDFIECTRSILENHSIANYFHNASEVWESDAEPRTLRRSARPPNGVKVSITLELSPRQYDVLLWLLACNRESIHQYADFACKDMIRAYLEAEQGWGKYTPIKIAADLYERWLAESQEEV